MRKSYSRDFENGPVAFGWVAMTWPPCWVAMLQIRGLPCKTWCPTHGSTSTARSAMVPTSSVAQKAGDTSVNSLARRSPPQPRPWGKMGSPSLSLPTWQPQRRATHQPPGMAGMPRAPLALAPWHPLAHPLQYVMRLALGGPGLVGALGPASGLAMGPAKRHCQCVCDCGYGRYL